MHKQLKKYALLEVKERIKDIEKTLFSSLDDTYKKEQGCYYTPYYIVKYIINFSIEKSLLKKINKNLRPNKRISSLKEYERERDSKIASLLLTSILPNFSICDISMGWGVFLLFAFDNLFNIYETSFRIIGNDISSFFPGITSEQEIKDYIVLNIISNNIYGTDLSTESIELAKLKFLEKSLRFLRKEESLLPEPNFIVGNSLIGSVSRKNSNISHKSFEKAYIELICQDIPGKNRSIVKEWLKNEKFVHWSLRFQKKMEGGGFDVIVGNPPYINVRRLTIPERQLYSRIYKTYNSNGDISNIFWERGVQLCKKNGIISFICPRYWLEGYDSNSLRDFLLSEASIKEVIDFRSNRSLFDLTENRLGVDTAIVTIEKTSQSGEYIDIYLLVDNKSVKEINKNRFRHLTINQSLLSEKRWVFEKSPIISYLEDKARYCLGDDKKYAIFEGICDIGKGCSTGNNRIFRLNHMSGSTYEGAEHQILDLEDYEKKCLRHLIKNSDIRRYSWKKRNQYWIFMKNEDLNKYPNLKSYLNYFKHVLERTQKKYKLSNFYDYAAYRSLSLINNSPKIVCPYQAEKNRFALIDSPLIDTINETDITTIVIKKKYSSKVSWFYLLAVLNSDIVNYYTKLMNKKIYTLYDFRSNQVARIPVIDHQQEEPFQTLVKYMIHISSRENKNNLLLLSKTQNIVNEILNLLIFEIYFQDILSSSFNDHIKDILPNLPLEKLSSTKTTRVLESWKNIANNESFKKNVKEIKGLSEVKEISRNLNKNLDDFVLF